MVLIFEKTRAQSNDFIKQQIIENAALQRHASDIIFSSKGLTAVGTNKFALA